MLTQVATEAVKAGDAVQVALSPLQIDVTVDAVAQKQGRAIEEALSAIRRGDPLEAMRILERARI